MNADERRYHLHCAISSYILKKAAIIVPPSI
jgi:hypothetical protein